MKPLYRKILPLLREVARAHGYALGLHGSTNRDLDLMAVPWTEEASDAEVLVEALRLSVNGHISQGFPIEKPHGRMAWAIRPLVENPEAKLYVDLSVTPKGATNA